MKIVEIKCIIEAVENDTKNAKVLVSTPIGCTTKEVSIDTSWENVDGMIDICNQLNEKNLGFVIHVKCKGR